MGARTSGREAALQMLFAFDLAGGDANSIIREFWRELPGEAEGREYADLCLRGVLSIREEVDGNLEAASQNWRIARMPKVDRNVLRIGIWELIAKKDIPRPVVIDEAVELAKRFGSENSGTFVNGVLDKVAELLGRSE